MESVRTHLFQFSHKDFHRTATVLILKNYRVQIYVNTLIRVIGILTHFNIDTQKTKRKDTEGNKTRKKYA